MTYGRYIVKRDGSVTLFNKEKITIAIQKAGAATGEYNEAIASQLGSQVSQILEHEFPNDAPDIESIQDKVEQVLLNAGYAKTMRAFSVYREQRHRLRSDQKTVVDVESSMNEYLSRDDWRVKANANQGYSLGGLILNASGKLIANYWLNHVYPPEIGAAHRNADIHVHDLDMLSGYCFTGDTRVCLLDGTTPTFAELVQTKPTEPFWVFSRDANNNIVPGLAHHPRLIKQNTPLVAVEISGGATIKCTPDHKFMLKDGSFKEAKDLDQGESLMPLYISKAGNYLQIFDTTLGMSKNIHRLVAEAIYGILDPGIVVHHRNGIKIDNRPENLECIADTLHRSQELMQTMQTDKWKKANAARLEQYNRDPNKRAEVSAFAQTRLRDAHGRFYNHTVLRRPYPIGSADAYCLTVDKYANFALADGVFVSNCAGWSLKTLLQEGLNGVPGKVDALPPKHFSSAVGQIVNFLGTLQNEWAGAQAFSSFDTYMAPFIRLDNLEYPAVKQNIQELIYNLNASSRWGSQCPFTNLTFDWTCPEDLRSQHPLIGGIEQDFTYGDLQSEMDMINQAYIEVMTKGDAKGRIFTFPIPTYNITKDFPWESPNTDRLFEMTAKYGIPYFQNFVNSDLEPHMVRSMCPLVGDTEVVAKLTTGSDVSVTGTYSIESIYQFVASDGICEVWNGHTWVKAKPNKTEMTNVRAIWLSNDTLTYMGENHLQPTRDYGILKAKELTSGMLVPINKIPIKGITFPDACIDTVKGVDVDYIKISHIEDLGKLDEKDLYCFEVDDDSHFFTLANGLVTHNCRLQLDLRELLKRGNGLFGSSEQTGSSGVCTLNCARLGYKYKGSLAALYGQLDHLLHLAYISLEIKRKEISKHIEQGLYPYTKRYLGTLRNHFSTIGVNGINEMIRNFTDDKEDITTSMGNKLACDFLDHIRDKMTEFQELSGHLYNLEATPELLRASW